jgi:hypothetical protein
MAQTYYPLAKSPILTPQQWSKMAQNWLGTGVIKGRLNELAVYADSTGMQVKVKSGQANINGIFYESDTEEVLPIAVADASNPRIDRIILRLDLAGDNVQLAVLQGVPAVSPVGPALTQNDARWEISLAYVYVNAGAATIAAGNIYDERVFTPAFITSSGETLQKGSGSFNVVSGVNSKTITFPKAFKEIPKVLANPNNSNRPDLYGQYTISGVTSTGFTFYINASVSATLSFDWIALGGV